MCATAERSAKYTATETIAVRRVDWEWDLLNRKLTAQ